MLVKGKEISILQNKATGLGVGIGSEFSETPREILSSFFSSLCFCFFSCSLVGVNGVVRITRFFFSSSLFGYFLPFFFPASLLLSSL